MQGARAAGPWYAGGAMNKVSTAVLVGFVGVGVAVIALPRADYRVKESHAAGKPQLILPNAPTVVASIKPPPILAEPPDAGAPDELEGDEASDAGTMLADGKPVPEIPNAPKSVTFGVVMVTYTGAQGASRGGRSKAEAEKLAGELAELARTDFAAAVKKGDPGSTESAGKMYRGILEPAPDYVLFSLEPEQVGGPVDTPRGFWIIRRIK